jgi:hypothetical protein
MTSTPVHTPTSAAFFVQSVVAFAVSLGAVVLGVTLLPVDPWIRAFLAVGVLFTISSAFTLAKCVRDRQEESSVAGRVDRARVDKLLTEHDPFKAVG